MTLNYICANAFACLSQSSFQTKVIQFSGILSKQPLNQQQSCLPSKTSVQKSVLLPKVYEEKAGS